MAGIQVGDDLITINDNPVRDVIDYRFHSSDTDLDIRLRRDEREFHVHIHKDFDDSLGIDFTSELFDGVRTCRNRCVFCFVDNLPRGMRKSLFIKDDDYRLSFLHGNFVTLSNLGDSDIDRILEQRLSPLYVSVHTTQPELRNRLLRPRHCPDILPVLRKLAEARIQMHTQIVICPGVNDCDNLDRTILDLAALHPAVQSIGVVPVGLTKYNHAQDLRLLSNTEAVETLIQLGNWQRRFRIEKGTRLVFASDELYLLAGRSLPGSVVYEGYPQYENGIGIVRSFLGELRGVAKRLPASVPAPLRVGLITGKSAEPFILRLAKVLNQVENLDVDVCAISNDFFGHTVTVAGLVTGTDVIDQLAGRELPELLLFPRVMLRDNSFLDDVKMDEVSRKLDVPCLAVDPSPSAALEVVTRYATTST